MVCLWNPLLLDSYGIRTCVNKIYIMGAWKDKHFIRRNPIRVLKSRVGNKLAKLSYLRVKENENWAQRKKETFISYFINQMRR